MFAAELDAYTHWGWVDLNCFYGDLSPMLVKAHDFDVVTFPDGV